MLLLHHLRLLLLLLLLLNVQLGLVMLWRLLMWLRRLLQMLLNLNTQFIQSAFNKPSLTRYWTPPQENSTVWQFYQSETCCCNCICWWSWGLLPVSWCWASGCCCCCGCWLRSGADCWIPDPFPCWECCWELEDEDAGVGCCCCCCCCCCCWGELTVEVGVMVVDAVATVDVVDDAGVEVVVTPDTFENSIILNTFLLSIRPSTKHKVRSSTKRKIRDSLKMKYMARC